MLNLTLARDWHVKQLDVTNVFLNSDLYEIVFIKLHLSFEDYSQPYLVCKLQKAFYGLK